MNKKISLFLTILWILFFFILALFKIGTDVAFYYIILSIVVNPLLGLFTLIIGIKSLKKEKPFAIISIILGSIQTIYGIIFDIFILTGKFSLMG